MLWFVRLAWQRRRRNPTPKRKPCNNYASCAGAISAQSRTKWWWTWNTRPRLHNRVQLLLGNKISKPNRTGLLTLSTDSENWNTFANCQGFSGYILGICWLCQGRWCTFTLDAMNIWLNCIRCYKLDLIGCLWTSSMDVGWPTTIPSSSHWKQWFSRLVGSVI